MDDVKKDVTVFYVYLADRIIVNKQSSCLLLRTVVQYLLNLIRPLWVDERNGTSHYRQTDHHALD